MGSRSSSRTQSTQTNENFTFNNMDNRVGKGGAGSGGGNTNFNLANSSGNNFKIEKTDLGAISKSFDFADSALQFAETASAPSANTINTIGKNAALLASVIAVGMILKARFAK